MQQRGAVVMQSRAGLLQPVRLDPKKQREFGTTATKLPQLSRTAEGRQMGPPRRMAEQPVGEPGLQAGDRPQPRRAPPQDKRQIQKELQEAQRSELGGAGGIGRARGAPQRPAFVPIGRHPAEMVRLTPGQGPPGPFMLPPHLHGGYFFPGPPKHFSSKSSEPPDKMRQGAPTPHGPRRAVGAMAHLVTPVRVSSGPTGISPRDIHMHSPKTHANSPPVTPRGFKEENTSPRFSSDAEKTPRAPVGKQEGGGKASPRVSAEVPNANSPRRALAEGDAAAPTERGRGMPKDQSDERLLRNLNLKMAETKSGKIPERGKLQTSTGAPVSEMNKTMNDVTSGRGRGNPAALMQHRNPYMAGGGAIYQMERKAQFGRGGAVGPPFCDPQGIGLESYGGKPAHFHGHSIPGLPQQQMPTMPSTGLVPMSSPKINTARAATDTSRMASQKKPPTPVAKKTDSPPKSPALFSPTLLIASPATSSMNSPRPSLMTTRNTPSKNTVSGKIKNAAKASPGNSPKSPSPRNSPARTYVITRKHSTTPLSVPSRKKAQATAPANVSTKLQIDSPAPQTTTATTGKDTKGRFQNPKSRLSAGGDLQTAKERPAVSPSAVAPTAQNQPSKETDESDYQAKELSDFNKEEQLTKTSPRIRKLARTSLQPVKNPSTPRSAVSDHLADEEEGESGNTTAKQPEGTPRKTSVGDGNKKLLTPVKNRKGAAIGAAHTEGLREPPRGRATALRHKRGQRAGKDSVDVAAALPDTSGNYTSAVHQWLRQSHYKVISPQQYRQHETIEEETMKHPGMTEKMMAFRDERPMKAAVPQPEKAPLPPPPEKGGRKGRVAATRKQKDIVVVQKPAAAPAGRASKKASKTAASSTETGKRKAGAKRGTAKARGTRRKKEKEPRSGAKLAPSACPRLRPKVGPAGDSGDLSSSSEDSSYLSASDASKKIKVFSYEEESRHQAKEKVLGKTV
ncbi:nascent polypeptide-associated complex subunit alpha, muscle-specific form-like [Schistocerca nitens]|uniref:nascent polypeptide-associated complex subunit alpha, muscle-specific form-like n=1 Tax=Schistocerca nitens TaxID=7011 RepID=UPI0021199E72|nr:nascent polypeptide-associated complex subunit alpha, muscle-specific form-like [Schistocerca nitens]